MPRTVADQFADIPVAAGLRAAATINDLEEQWEDVAADPPDGSNPNTDTDVAARRGRHAAFEPRLHVLGRRPLRVPADAALHGDRLRNVSEARRVRAQTTTNHNNL